LIKVIFYPLLPDIDNTVNKAYFTKFLKKAIIIMYKSYANGYNNSRKQTQILRVII